MNASDPQTPGKRPLPERDDDAFYIGAGEEWHGDSSQGPGSPVEPTGEPPRAAEPPKSTPPPPTSVATPGHRRGRGDARGVARSVETRTHDSSTVLSFRVDQYDPSGNRVQPIGVELWHHRHGQVSDGEEVEVSGHWRRGTLRAERIVNLSTGAQIKGVSRRTRVIVISIILALFIGWAAFLAYLGITQS